MRPDEMDAFLNGHRAKVAKIGAPLVAPSAREFITAVRTSGMLDARETEMPLAAAVLALAEAHPAAATAWREEEADLFKRAEWIIRRAKDDRPGQNDALMVRWRVLGKVADAEAIGHAACRRDGRGHAARWMLSHVLQGDPALRAAIREILWMMPPDLRHEIRVPS